MLILVTRGRNLKRLYKLLIVNLSCFLFALVEKQQLYDIIVSQISLLSWERFDFLFLFGLIIMVTNTMRLSQARATKENGITTVCLHNRCNYIIVIINDIY